MTPDELRNLENEMPIESSEVFQATEPIMFPAVNDSSWEDNLQTTEKGAIKNSNYNIAQILHHDSELNNLFAYNELNDKVMLTRAISHFKAGYNLGTLPTHIAVNISKKYGINVTSQTVYGLIENEASNHTFNPAKDYFRESFLAWDKKERLDSFFIDYLGVEDNAVTRKMTRIFFEGLVLKVKNPFIKFDRVLDLVGEQGVGKTWIMYKLGGFGRFYTDQITSVTDKDSKAEMTANIIVNDDEMAVTNKMTFEEMKAFISSTEITYRKPYATTQITKGKGFVIVRSTNNTEYLKDKTGNRRFMTMVVSKKRRTKNVSDLTDEDVMQVIGEAVSRYGSNDSLTEESTLSNEELQTAQYDSQYISLEEELMREYLAQNPQIKFVSTASIIENGLKQPNAVGNSSLARKVSYYMSNLEGWERKVQKINGQRVRGYARL